LKESIISYLSQSRIRVNEVVGQLVFD
jgi:hypothetical protein